MKTPPLQRFNDSTIQRILLFSVLIAIGLAPAVHAQKKVDLGMSRSGIRHVQVPLSAAQINGMYAAPVKLIETQGAGHSIIISKAAFTITRSATAFANGGAAIVQYGSTTHGGGTQALDSTMAATVITGAAGATTTIRNGAVISDSTASVNAALYISNATAAFDTGTGTAVIDLWYYVN